MHVVDKLEGVERKRVCLIEKEKDKEKEGMFWTESVSVEDKNCEHKQCFLKFDSCSLST